MLKIFTKTIAQIKNILYTEIVKNHYVERYGGSVWKGKVGSFWSASLANIVSADQVSAETATELVTNQWEIAEQANEVAQSKTDILADMQAEVENTELTISEDDTQTVVTETDMDITLSDFNELGFLLLDESKEGDDAKIQPDNYSFKDLANHTQIF